MLFDMKNLKYENENNLFTKLYTTKLKILLHTHTKGSEFNTFRDFYPELQCYEF